MVSSSGGAHRLNAELTGDRPIHLALTRLQTNAYLVSFIVSEVNAGLFKYFLYFEDRGEVSLHNSFVLLDPLKSGQANPGGARELILVPA